ncbi:MaoC/PaaZ C-terminal domain-containing protein [Nesterenkonia halophila]|uniref:MaoC family dehydratase n=1 Tax=Nesterenkonia halophila TaxID=302044 RepID=UPI0012909FC4|nr:MaoC family dehydratase [Nesterenkonia halophila]
MSTPQTPAQTPDIAAVEKGQEIGRRTVALSRTDLIRYAAASGDHNPIHWNERFAREVGLDGVIAHGMLTMGAAVDLVTEWVGDPGRVVDYQARFTKPVPVPDVASGAPDAPTAELRIVGTVGTVDAEAATVRVDLAVTLDEAKVLAKSQVIVQL